MRFVGTLANARLKVAVVILCGGRSSRMGRDKATVELGGRRLLDLMKDLAERVGDAVILSGSGADYDGLHDDEPGLGPLGGLKTAVRALQRAQPECTHFLVLPIDMPFLKAATLGNLIARGAQARAACFTESELPLLIQNNEGVAETLDELLRSEEARGRSVGAFIRAVGGVRLAPPEVSGTFEFRNLNTPRELEEARNECENVGR
ncbi:MAG: molybdenum cofactor guanylyltransferase [Deltaproteobacteria bacterium]|nr:molybdenum cofactor guanylyltransferase [Deltaproteobacteria bacterium]